MFGPIALTCLMSFGLHADTDTPAENQFCAPPESSDCCPQLCPCCSKPPMWVTVRHIDPNGIGYHPGYTTIEAFISPFEPLCDAWIPFIDVRGHVFNNGKWAANAGLGLRYLTGCSVWGANVYYDYRKTKHFHYNQVGVGLEWLGQVWEARINGYLPVGKTEKFFSRFRFDRFRGNSLILSRKREFAMKGFNAEVGYHWDCWECFPLYFAAGPYYLEGKGRVAWGGKLRARVDLWDCAYVQGNISYDKVFKWIGQAEIGITFGFGCSRQIKTRCGNCCDTALTLSDRSLQPVDRFEIIAVDEHRVRKEAINPFTGQPWFFIFVNNLSSSHGTFESPFPTLLQAQNASRPNDAIYVFPGDGTTRGMDAGITLQNGQWFLGAGNTQIIPTTVGNIVIPPLASIQPKITNTAGDIVTVANNNVVSGFDFIFNTLNQSGIAGTGINNLTAIQNTFITSFIDTNGIFLTNPTGVVNVDRSLFSGFADKTSPNFGNGVLVLLNNGGTLDTLGVSNSAFSNISNPASGNGGAGINVDFEGLGGKLNNYVTSRNMFSNLHNNSDGGVSAILNAAGSVVTNMTVSDSTFSGITANSDAIGLFPAAGTVISNFSVSGCSFSGINGEVGGFGSWGLFTQGNGTISNISFANSTFSNMDSTGTIANFNTTGIFINVGTNTNTNISGCTFNNITNGALGIDCAPVTLMQNINISGCSFGNISGLNINNSSAGVALFYTNGFGGTIGNANISSNTFSNISNGAFGFITLMNPGPSTINNLGLLNNTFTNIGFTGGGISVPLKLANPANMNVDSNTFTGPTAGFAGYATFIDLQTGNLCLRFIGNNATPTSAPDPYRLQNSGGTFNRTTGSDNTTNTGTIDIVGVVGAPGSCAQP